VVLSSTLSDDAVFEFLNQLVPFATYAKSVLRQKILRSVGKPPLHPILSQNKLGSAVWAFLALKEQNDNGFRMEGGMRRSQVKQ